MAVHEMTGDDAPEKKDLLCCSSVVEGINANDLSAPPIWFVVTIVVPKNYKEIPDEDRTSLAHIQFMPEHDDPDYGTTSCRVIIRRYGSVQKINLKRTWINLAAEVSSQQENCLCNHCREAINSFLHNAGLPGIDDLLNAVDMIIEKALNGGDADDGMTVLSNLPVYLN